MPLLEIRNLQLDFGRGASAVRAVHGVSLFLPAGKTLCLGGESGAAKPSPVFPSPGSCPPFRAGEGEFQKTTDYPTPLD